MAEPDANRLKYEQWVHAHAPALFRYAMHLCGRRHLAEDLLQETFTQAWKSLARQKDADKVRSWLFAILRHCHAHHVRDNQNSRGNQALAASSDEHPPDRRPAPLHTLAQQDALQAALDQLSPPNRETFLLVFAEGLTCQKAADALHIPLGTVLSRLHSARRTLRVALADPSPVSAPQTPMHREDLPTQ
jgi:RNA polymerase sigma-70 factor (ECF subfamily)